MFNVGDRNIASLITACPSDLKVQLIFENLLLRKRKNSGEWWPRKGWEDMPESGHRAAGPSVSSQFIFRWTPLLKIRTVLFSQLKKSLILYIYIYMF